MKITRIKIKNYLQFQDLDIDLTYPKGHAKEGKALDKVCIIGRSGTGKTTLLNLVSYAIHDNYDWNQDNQKILRIQRFNFDSEAEFFTDGDEDNNLIKILPVNNKNQVKSNYANQINLKLFFSENYLDTFQKAIAIGFEKWKDILGNDNFPENYFTSEYINPVFESYWSKILSLYTTERDWLARLGKAELTGNEIKKDLEAGYNTWRKDNPNPIHELADILNPLLSTFNVKVNKDFEFDSTKTLNILRFETLNGTSIPTENVSTGIRAIVLSALIFHHFKPKDALILFDEPEHSLYPDAQIEFVKMLLKLSTDSQYFFATHSPLIVSEFEPWEIVELKHDFENGGVFRELYYPAEKENHVDNYFWNTKALRWDSILTRIFDLVTLGGEDRGKELKKLSKLDSEISGMNSPDAEKKGKIKSYNDLADKIDFWRASEPENPYETNREKPE